MKKFDLLDLIRLRGRKECFEILLEAMNEEDLKKRLRPEEFSLRELWEGFVGPVSRTLAFAQQGEGFVTLTEDAVNSSLFQALAGKVVGDAVIDGYNRAPYI